MQSLQILDFERFGYKNTEKLYYLVISRGKELDHRNWTYDRAFQQLSGSEWGEFEAKFSKIPDIPDPGVYVDR